MKRTLSLQGMRTPNRRTVEPEDSEEKSEKNWGDQRGLNPRQPESQSGALPTELWPPSGQRGSNIHGLTLYVQKTLNDPVALYANKLGFCGKIPRHRVLILYLILPWARLNSGPKVFDHRP